MASKQMIRAVDDDNEKLNKKQLLSFGCKHEKNDNMDTFFSLTIISTED